MLKSALYSLLFVITTARLADIIYLLVNKKTSLPVAVIGVTIAMIVYGIILLVKKFIGNVTLKQLMAFYVVQTLTVGFNLAYVAVASPLRVSVAETFVVGTFLDILISCCVVYFCMKQIRSHYFAVAQPVTSSSRHG